jgi:hypothetical protein
MKTLMGTDGSPEATPALRVASRFLRKEKNEVSVLCVAPEPAVHASIPGSSGLESNSPRPSGPTFCHQFARSIALLLFHWHVRNIPVLPVIPIPRSYIVYASPGMSASSLARLTVSE